LKNAGSAPIVTGCIEIYTTTLSQAERKGMRLAQHHRIPVVEERVSNNEFGGVLDSTLVTKPEVHVVMAANHVNPKL
jgi:DNA/RNA endonuclease YhcR with UshA esterase domain